MNTKINKLKKSLLDMQPEEFQSLLDNAKNIIVETLNKIENDEV